MNFSKIKYYFLLPLILFIFSCQYPTDKRTPTFNVSKVKIGMNLIEVLEIAGIPDTKINIGIVTDEFGLQTKTEEWHYGNNQLIVIVNDTVNAIDTDLKNTYEKIQHIIDSARAAGDTSVLIQAMH